MSKKIIFINGLIDLAQPRLGTKVIFKTDDFLHQQIELSIKQIQYLKMACLISMESGWMGGSLEEKELKVMII